MIKYFVLLALTGCAHSQEIALSIYPDNNSCDAVYMGSRLPHTDNFQGLCQEYNEAWKNVIDGFHVLPMSKMDVDDQWKIIFVDSGGESFKLPQGWVYGATVCDSKIVLLGTIRALPHEFGHMLDCENGVPQQESFKHLHWRERGWCDRISSLSTLPVKCEED